MMLEFAYKTYTVSIILAVVTCIIYTIWTIWKDKHDK